MIFCYIDESGTPDLPGNTSHYVLAGLSIPVSEWKTCETAVEKVKHKYGLPGAEIHTRWILWPYLEQTKIDGFEEMSYAERRYEAEKYRNRELLRLQSPKSHTQYHKTKKNYRATNAYIHLSYEERKAFIKEIAELIGS